MRGRKSDIKEAHIIGGRSRVSERLIIIYEKDSPIV